MNPIDVISKEVSRKSYLTPYKSNMGTFLQNYMTNKLRTGLPSYYANPAKNQISQAFNSRLNSLKQQTAGRGMTGSGSSFNAMSTLDTGRIGALGDVMSNMAMQNLQLQQNMLTGLLGQEQSEANRAMQLKQMEQQDYWNQEQLEQHSTGFGDFLGGLIGIGTGGLLGGIGGALGAKWGEKIG